MYIFRSDRWGRRFAALLAERARAGIQVRVLCDWFGCWSTPRRLFRDLRANGGEMRYFNPPRPMDPFAAVRRTTRKATSVDATVTFISGPSIAEPGMGDPHRRIPPWPDRGAEAAG